MSHAAPAIPCRPDPLCHHSLHHPDGCQEQAVSHLTQSAPISAAWCCERHIESLQQVLQPLYTDFPDVDVWPG